MLQSDRRCLSHRRDCSTRQRCVRAVATAAAVVDPPSGPVQAFAVHQQSRTPFPKEDISIIKCKAVTKRILDCNSLATLAAVCCHHQQQLTPIHITAALTVCAKRIAITRRGSETPHSQQQLHSFVVDLLRLLLAQRHLCSAREVSTTLWCFAKLQHELPAASIQQLLCHFFDVAPNSSCQASATVLYALAKMGVQLDATHLDCLLSVLLKSVCRAAEPASHLPPQWLPVVYAQHQQQQHHTQQHQQQQDLQPWQARDFQPGQTCSPTSGRVWALGNAVWALARMEQPAVARAWLLPLLHLLRSSIGTSATISGDRRQVVSSQQQVLAATAGADSAVMLHTASAGCHVCAVTVWACATILATTTSSPAQYPQQPHAVHPHPHRQQLQDGHLQERHQQRFNAAVISQVSQMLQEYQHWLVGLEPQSACMVLWGVNRLGIVPSQRWCQQYYAAVQRIAGQLSPSQCAAVLSGIAYLPVRPPAALCSYCLAGLQPELHMLPAARLSQVLRACARLRVRPPAGWVAALLGAVLSRPQEHTPAVLSMLLHAASKVGFKPPAAVFTALLGSIRQQLQGFRPHDTAKLLSGCAALHLQLPEHMHTALLQGFMTQLQAASPSAVTLVLRSLACAQQQQQLQQQQQEQEQLPSLGRAGLGATWRMQRPAGAARCSCTCGSSRTGAYQGLVYLKAGQAGACTPAAAAAMQAGKGVAQQADRSPQQWPGPVWHQYAVMQQQGAQQQQQQQQLVWSTQVDAPLPSCWVCGLFDRAGALLHSMRPMEVCQCVWAAAWLQPVTGTRWLQAINHTLPGRVHELAAGDIALLLWSFARLRHAVHPERHLLKQLLWRSQELMLCGSCTPRDLTSLLWGFWRIGASGRRLPLAWVDAFHRAATGQLTSFSNKQLGVTLRACMLMQMPLGQQLLDALVLQVELRSAGLSRPEQASMASSLARLRQQHYASRAAGVQMAYQLLDSSAEQRAAGGAGGLFDGCHAGGCGPHRGATAPESGLHTAVLATVSM